MQPEVGPLGGEGLRRSPRIASSGRARHVAEARAGPLERFDLLEDDLVLTILGSLGELAPLHAASLVCRRFAQLCTEQFIWEQLLLAQLQYPVFSWSPCTNGSWRERHKQ